MRFAPVRIEFWRETLSNGHVVDSARVLDGAAEYRMIDNLWAPTKWRVDNEGTGFDWQFEWHSFNQPIDDSRFKIEGMDLPTGTVVENRILGAPILESRIGGGPQPSSDRPPPTLRRRSSSWLVVGNACVLIAIASVWLYRLRRVRSTH